MAIKVEVTRPAGMPDNNKIKVADIAPNKAMSKLVKVKQAGIGLSSDYKTQIKNYQTQGKKVADELQNVANALSTYKEGGEGKYFDKSTFNALKKIYERAVKRTETVRTRANQLDNVFRDWLRDNAGGLAALAQAGQLTEREKEAYEAMIDLTRKG